MKIFCCYKIPQSSKKTHFGMTEKKEKPFQINERVFRYYEISQSPKKAHFEMTE